MSEESINDENQRFSKLPNLLHCPQSGEIDLSEDNTLTKLEREALFNEAENMRLEGKNNESADIYMRCLFSLEVKTAFPSLPRCLRALANFFLEKNQFVKAIHFVQAERLYYESALMDTAALQQRLTGKVNLEEKYNCPLTELSKENFDSSKERLLEYTHLIEYFRGKKSLETAILYAEKSMNLNIDVYGEQSEEVKEAFDLINDLNREITSEKNYLNKIGDVKNNPKIDNKTENENLRQDEETINWKVVKMNDKSNYAINKGDKDPEKIDEHYQSYLGFSSSVPVKDISEITDSSSAVHCKSILNAERSTILKIFKTTFRFILICLIFIIMCTVVLTLLYQLMMSFRKETVEDHMLADDQERVTNFEYFQNLQTIIIKPIKKFYNSLFRMIFKETDKKGIFWFL